MRDAAGRWEINPTYKAEDASLIFSLTLEAASWGGKEDLVTSALSQSLGNVSIQSNEMRSLKTTRCVICGKDFMALFVVGRGWKYVIIMWPLFYFLFCCGWFHFIYLFIFIYSQETFFLLFLRLQSLNDLMHLLVWNASEVLSKMYNWWIFVAFRSLLIDVFPTHRCWVCMYQQWLRIIVDDEFKCGNFDRRW